MISRYWHTLRHLRPVQFYWRLWFRLYRPTPDLRPAQAVRPVPGRWVPPVAKPASLLGPTTFRFLNETHALAGAGYEAAGGRDPWNDPARDKLWLYNLHYFDDLNAAGREERQPWHLALLQRWVNENSPGQGNGWEPYPTSLRIVNWIKWSLTFAPEGGGVAVALPPACLQSLAVQARWLSRRLEHHLLGNHLFANAKALVFAGAFFVGPEADRWRTLGLRLLARELDEQILPDGGHFERSPMYHAILLEDVLDVLNLAGAYPGLLDDAVLALCRVKAVAMLNWLAPMTHPDGEISFFNDAAFDIAPTLADLVRYAEDIPAVGQARRSPAVSQDHPTSAVIPATTPVIPATSPSVIPAGKPESSAKEGSAAVVRSAGARHSPTIPGLGPGFPAGTTDVQCCWLRDSGYVRLAAGPAVALLDVAPIGPDYLPGHAHADTLSFELTLFGQRVIVNGGTSRYGSGPERLAERGTAAHSTVQIDGADSSEVWGGFRVARRARPFDVQVPTGEGPLQEVSAAHDGYRRLAGRPVHRRTWDLTTGRFVVSDRLDGGFATAVARFHLHPAIEVVADAAGCGDANPGGAGGEGGVGGEEGGIGGAPASTSNGIALDPPASQDEDGVESSCGRFLLPGGQVIHWQVQGGRVRVVPEQWHPAFGLGVPAQGLEVRFAGRQCRLELAWATGSCS